MKKFILLWSFFISAWNCFAQLQSQVDERMELAGIVFRLAGAEEYVNNEVVNYVLDIDSFFAPYKDHPLIRYVKKIRERDEVAYNAVSGTIFYLEIKNGQVRLAPHVDLNCLLQDPRWTKETFLTYVKLLNRFYKDSKFHGFFNRHKALYAETEKRFNSFLADIHTEWFNDFFGQSLTTPLICVSLTNGRSNYGGSPSCLPNIPEGSIIIGCSRVDSDGIPVFNKDINPDLFFTVMHELCHIFTGPLVDKYQQDMIQAADTIFPYVKEALAKVAYGDANSMLVEGINNLCTNMYFREYPTRWEKYMIRDNENYGFIWMRRFVRFMDNFYEHRDIYPHFEDFMPQIISFINSCGRNIEQIVFEYNHSAPYVVNVFPSPNTVVSAGIKVVKVDFSQPMWDVAGIYHIENVARPDSGMRYWNEDKTSLYIPVNLKKRGKYGLLLCKGIFQSSETFLMKEDFEILFETEE
jgi:hypothetical protein